mgnify:CR=1 FL=1
MAGNGMGLLEKPLIRLIDGLISILVSSTGLSSSGNSAVSASSGEDSSDAGSSGYVTYQSLRIKSTKQRLITSGAQMDMGFTIPASIGVYLASKNRTVVGITGDGSFQLNIQELQTLVNYNIPLKTIIMNNHIYGITKAFQKTQLVNTKSIKKHKIRPKLVLPILFT